MIKWLRNLSFRNKLLFAFLVIGVVPLLICTVLMLNIFRVTLAGNARDAAESTSVSSVNFPGKRMLWIST